MHPFISYDLATSIVAESEAASARGWWFRNRDPAEGRALPSADTALAKMMENELDHMEAVDTRL